MGGFRGTRWLRPLAARKRPHRSAASVRLSRSATGDPPGCSLASARLALEARRHRRSVVQRQGPHTASGGMGAGGGRGGGRPGLSPALRVPASMQTGSEAITNAADGMTSNSDESHLRPAMAVYAPFASSTRQMPATPISEKLEFGIRLEFEPAVGRGCGLLSLSRESQRNGRTAPRCVAG